MPPGDDEAAPEGIFGAEGGSDASWVITVPVRTKNGEKYAVIPTRTARGEAVESEQALEMVQAGELAPLAVVSSMEEAKCGKA